MVYVQGPRGSLFSSNLVLYGISHIYKATASRRLDGKMVRFPGRKEEGENAEGEKRRLL